MDGNSMSSSGHHSSSCTRSNQRTSALRISTATSVRFYGYVVIWILLLVPLIVVPSSNNTMNQLLVLSENRSTTTKKQSSVAVLTYQTTSNQQQDKKKESSIVFLPPPSSLQSPPLVMIVACTRSTHKWASIRDTTIYQYLIPSIFHTTHLPMMKQNTSAATDGDIDIDDSASSQRPPYRVELLLAFDTGDAFWEMERHRHALQSYASMTKNYHTNETSSSSSSSFLPIHFVSIPRDPARPFHIPFNTACRAAYEYGADYIVRINDDSAFVVPKPNTTATNDTNATDDRPPSTWPSSWPSSVNESNWITHAMAQLAAFDPPNLGVVGPTCEQGNTRILTHDMVHAPTHLSDDGLFGELGYYPDEFDNWWIDNWISLVYGPNRTRKMPPDEWEMHHYVTAHGRRYSVDATQRANLNMTLERGRTLIREYVRTYQREEEKRQGVIEKLIQEQQQQAQLRRPRVNDDDSAITIPPPPPPPITIPLPPTTSEVLTQQAKDHMPYRVLGNMERITQIFGGPMQELHQRILKERQGSAAIRIE